MLDHFFGCLQKIVVSFERKQTGDLGDDDVSAGSGLAANNGGDLHTGGGLSESVSRRDSEMSGRGRSG